jgi:hypothetical protein
MIYNIEKIIVFGFIVGIILVLLGVPINLVKICLFLIQFTLIVITIYLKIDALKQLKKK